MSGLAQDLAGILGGLSYLSLSVRCRAPSLFPLDEIYNKMAYGTMHGYPYRNGSSVLGRLFTVVEEGRCEWHTP